MRIQAVLSGQIIPFTLAICLIGASSVRGATLEVPSEYPSIQDALGVAVSGDIVLLAPGVYSETIEINTAVTLASWFLTSGDPSYIATTIIDGGGGASTVNFPASAEPGSSIVGLTIQNGTDGIRSKAHFTLANSVIRATKDGIDYKAGGGGVLRDSVFEDNTDDGIDLDHNIDILIENCVIRNNGDDGIEIRFQNWVGPTLQILIRDNAIYGNDEDGVQIIDYDNPTVTDRFVEISGNAIYANVDAGIGMMSGAISKENFEAANVEERIHIFGNTFSGNDHGISGGDLTAVVNNIFVGHTTLALKGVDGLSAVAYNLFFANAQDAIGSNVDVATTINADPLLAPDLTLQAGSPAIDAGTPQFSLQGVPVVDLDPAGFSGLAPDLGAFEFASTPSDPPDVPMLANPADGAIDIELTPSLSWTGDADVFEIEIATDPGFGSVIETLIEPGPSTSHTVGPGVLANLTAYYWRARASDTGGTSDWSAAFGFTTEVLMSPPGPPALLAPADGALDVVLEPTLSWAGTADRYEVEVAEDPSFSILVFSASVTEPNVMPPPGALSHETAFVWRVAGINVFGMGAWSSTAAFTTLLAPDITAPSIPQNLISPSKTGTSIEVAWDASTDARGVTGYNIFIDGLLAASESEPDHVAVNLDPATEYAFEVSAFDAAGNESAKSDVFATSTASLSPPILFSAQVSSPNDDAEERPSGRVKLGSGDLELATDGSTDQIVGMRFANLSLPPGAIVTAARIRFTTDEVKTEPVSLAIYGQASDDAQPFSAQNGDLSSRPATSVSVPWNPPPWQSVGESGPDQETLDLSAILQEIVVRPGWTEGAAMALFVTGSGNRAAESYEGAVALAPVLEGEYVVMVGPPGPPDVLPPTQPANLRSPLQTGNSITLEWDASMDEVGVAGYEVHRDGEVDGDIATTRYVSTGLSSETEYDFEVFAFDEAENFSASSGVVSQSTGAPSPLSLEVSVSPATNDAEERLSSGSVNLGSSDLEIGEDKSRPQIVGVRFTGVAIPAGATILSAAIQFQVDEVSTGAASLEIRADAADAAPVFSTASGDLSSRPTTSGLVAWDPPQWPSVGEAGPDQRTPDLSVVVQEVVSRPGWSSGNALALLISGSGARVAESANGAAAPVLSIEYQGP